MRAISHLLWIFGLLVFPAAGGAAEPDEGDAQRVDRPNILLAIADDWSWPHAGVYGDATVHTPAFDRLAREGVLFTHAFCPASQCSPSRAALLSGRNIWQLEEAGTQASLFPAKFQVYTDCLQQIGYHVGYTGKPWGPGNWRAGGRSANPAGNDFNARRLKPATGQISDCDYAANFADFLQACTPGTPFCFWFGCHEPHRNYEDGSGIRAGMDPAGIDVPPFYPDNDVVRSDLLDYQLEVEWFDRQLDQMVRLLERSGQLHNTLVVVTADNGMPFPRAKATLYESGTRLPLAMRWPARIPAGRVIDDLVSLIDMAPTFLEAAGIEPPREMTGRSLLDILTSAESGRVDRQRDWVVLGKERHNHARFDNLGYPTRAIRTRRYLYIHNLKPDRWPIGDPPGYYCHTKMINPTKEFILRNQHLPAVDHIFQLTYAKRPGDELYDLREDPHCMRNLAADPDRAGVLQRLRTRLQAVLREQGDPRVVGYGDIFESYPYYGTMSAALGGFHKTGEYNPAYLPPHGSAASPPRTER